MIAQAAAIAVAGTAEASSKKKKDTHQTEAATQPSSQDGAKRDDNTTNKSKEWYRGDFMGLDDDWCELGNKLITRIINFRRF